MRFLRLAVLLSAVVGFGAGVCVAQVASELKGHVTDGSGAAVGGARVTLTQGGTAAHFAATTSKGGDFAFAELVPGSYTVDVEATGFEHLRRGGVTLVVGQTIGLDLPLRVGAASETVDVTEDAPALQTQTSDLQFTIPQKTIEAIPLNSRNFIQLSTLSAGVELPPGTLLPRINGGRPRTNEYLYDGISALQPEPGQVAFFPILDDIAQFTVESDNVSAEFGRFNGGVVNVATRYGTNQVHGSVFEYFRNEDLNARNYFAQSGVRKPEYRRNLYGGTIGLPVLKNRLFFFSDYQGIKARIGKTVYSTVPTAAERIGNFAGVGTIYNPATTTTVNGRIVRQPFSGNVISTPLDAAAVALLARIPLSNLSGVANNYVRTANDDDHQNQFDTRLDANFGTHDHGFARYTYYNEVEQPVTPFPDGSGAVTGSVLGTGNVTGLTNILGQQAVANETHTFNAHLVNDARVGYTRRANDINGVTVGGTASAVTGVAGIPANAAFNNALPLFTFTGFQQVGSSAGTFSQYQTGVWEFVDTVLITRGKHTIKAGLDMRWYQLNAVAPSNPTGSFAFTTTGTDTQAATGATSATGGNAFASFLLGQVDTFSIDLQQSKLRPRDFIHEYFVQDDWSVTPALTLNLGVRYTLHNPSTEKNNQGAIFNTATQLLEYVGVNGHSRSARELHYGNFAPRLGFAYALDPKTTVRSGFGIVFIDQSGITTPFTVPQFPFIQNVQQKTQDSLNAAFKLSNGPTVQPVALTPQAGLGQSVYTVKRTAGSGYVEQWNLAFQRALTNSLTAQIAYAGSHIVHVGIPDSNFNQITAAQLAQGLTNPAALTAKVANPCYGLAPASSTLGAATVTAQQLLRPYPCYQNVAVYRNNSGTTNYNALEAQVDQRLSHGLSFTFAYTHSRIIDDASSVFSSTVFSSPSSSSLVGLDAYNPSRERDVSSGDTPNVISGSLTYALPAGRGHRFASRGVALAALGGWTANLIATAQSGMPVTVTQATNTNSAFGFATARPNQIRNPNFAGNTGQRSPAKFFDTGAFVASPQFTLGNASRDPVRGPAYRDLDLSLIKHTPLSEKTDLEFRAELFNVTNTPAFSQPNGSFGTAAFGTITTTAAEQRVAQFAVRISR